MELRIPCMRNGGIVVKPDWKNFLSGTICFQKFLEAFEGGK